MSTPPVEIRRVENRELHILWADGHRTVFTNTYLRENCPCAACVHEFTGQRILKPASVPSDIRALEISLVGQVCRPVPLERWAFNGDLSL